MKNDVLKEALHNLEAGAKYDQDKPQIFRGALSYFPSAITAVARVSEFGAEKYDWYNWKNVPDGKRRYTEALVRHIVAETSNGVDSESGLLHAAHAAWCALARLEFMLEEMKEE